MKVYFNYDYDHGNKMILNVYLTNPSNNRIEIDDPYFLIKHIFELKNTWRKRKLETL